MTYIDLTDAAGTTQRAVSVQNAFGFLSVPRLVAMVKALYVTTDELLSVTAIKAHLRSEDPVTRRLWKKFH